MQYIERIQDPDAAKGFSPERLASRYAGEPEVEKRYREAFERSYIDGMLDYRANYAEFVATTIPDSPQLAMPVLQFHGLNDRAVHRDGLRDTWNWVDADYTLVTLPGVGHFVQSDAARARLFDHQGVARRATLNGRWDHDARNRLAGYRSPDRSGPSLPALLRGADPSPERAGRMATTTATIPRTPSTRPSTRSMAPTLASGRIAWRWVSISGRDREPRTKTFGPSAVQGDPVVGRPAPCTSHTEVSQVAAPRPATGAISGSTTRRAGSGPARQPRVPAPWRRLLARVATMPAS